MREKKGTVFSYYQRSKMHLEADVARRQRSTVLESFM